MFCEIFISILYGKEISLYFAKQRKYTLTVLKTTLHLTTIQYGISM